MTCPICKKRMLTGFIPILAVVWVPQYGKMKNVFAYNKVKDKKNGFRIGKHPYFSHKKQPAYYCQNCEIVLIDTTIDEF